MSWVEEFTHLVEAGEKEQWEALWLAKLEEGIGEPDSFLAANLTLRRAGKKKDAHVLLELAWEQAKEQGCWKAVQAFAEECLRLGVGNETQLRESLVEAFRQQWKGRPSLEMLLAHFDLLHHKNPVEACEELTTWLVHEVGEIFAMAGRGPGRVVEINPKLGVLRLDFEKEKRVPVPIGAASRHLLPLPPGHFLRRRLEEPQQLREELLADPGRSLVQLLLSFPQPMSVTEIREAVGSLLADSEWASWWNRAKKSNRILTEGRGSALRYRALPEEAGEEALLERFVAAGLPEKLELAKTVKPGNPVALTIGEKLMEEAEKASGAWAFAAAALARKLGVEASRVQAFRRELLKREGPLALLQGLSEAADRELVLAELMATGDKETLVAWLPSETHPRLLRLLAEKLLELGEEGVLRQFFSQVFLHPARFAAAWVWALELTEGPVGELLAPKRTGSAVLRLVEAGERKEFAAFRQRIRALLSPQSWVASVVKGGLTEEQARRLLHILQNPGVLRQERAWLKRAVVARFPHLLAGPSQDTGIPALSRTVMFLQEQLHNLLHKEIPATLKAIQAAREEGDLRENFEYHAQRARQELLSARAAKLQADLARVQIIDPQKIDTSAVKVGCQVVLEGTNSADQRVVTILGPYEANPEEGIYSHASEVGQELLGKRVGSEVRLAGGTFRIVRIDPVNEETISLREAL